ncbi:proteoglycan 4b isoform X2 [Lampris incognitus]|uniref:proteoglycan 4b isoform X2 n=1 Tax=Lampris incognitus TaxID=2546036 RepID=UPI0024B4D568|nr:proteoglycan 4b isoform X2 [Lampris incognitus]
MSSAVLCASILLVCAFSRCAAQVSCSGRCGAEYYRGYMCQCDYGCLQHEECCKDFESQCTTGDSCKGRCGEFFRRGRLCNCDPDCGKFNQCCPDYKSHCDAEEPVIKEPVESSSTFVDDDDSKDDQFDPKYVETQDPQDDFDLYDQTFPNLPDDSSSETGQDYLEEIPTPDTTSGYEPMSTKLLEVVPTDPTKPNAQDYPDTELIPEDTTTISPELEEATTQPSDDKPNKDNASISPPSPTNEEVPTDSAESDPTSQSETGTALPLSTPTTADDAQELQSGAPTEGGEVLPDRPTPGPQDEYTSPPQLEVLPSHPDPDQASSSDMSQSPATTPAFIAVTNTASETTATTNGAFSEPATTTPFPVTSASMTYDHAPVTTISSLSDPESESGLGGVTPESWTEPGPQDDAQTTVTPSPKDSAQDSLTTAGTTADWTKVTPALTEASSSKPDSKPLPDPSPTKPSSIKPSLTKPTPKPPAKPIDTAQTPNIDNTRDYQADDSNDTDLCSGRPTSAVTTLKNGTMVVFRGHYFWTLDRNRVPGPARGITQTWGIPSPIDTVFTRCNCQGKTYILKGAQYWRFDNDVLDPGYPNLLVNGFDGLRGQITAALSVPQYKQRRESVYFFKRGGLVQKYSYKFGTSPSCGRKVQHTVHTSHSRMTRQTVSSLEPAINIHTSWRRVPSTITSAVSAPSRRVPEGYKYYVFSRSNYYSVKMNGERPVVGYPQAITTPLKNSSKDFFKCPKKV